MTLYDPQETERAIGAAAELASLEKSYLAEVRATQPDMARMRALRTAITSARRRLERAHDILPPHTD